MLAKCTSFLIQGEVNNGFPWKNICFMAWPSGDVAKDYFPQDVLLVDDKARHVTQSPDVIKLILLCLSLESAANQPNFRLVA